MRTSKAITFALSVVALVCALQYAQNSEQRSATHSLTGEELRELELLKLQGRGLDQPVNVRSFASSIDEAKIRSAGRRLEADGMHVVVHFCSEDGPWGPKGTWTLFADVRIVPTAENLHALRDRVKPRIESEGVEYNGWGSPGQP